MSDTNERSVASAGSVAGKPVAWAVLLDGRALKGLFAFEEEATRESSRLNKYLIENGCVASVSPLYCHPRPTLSAEEREAVDNAQNHIDGYDGEWGDEIAATLRGLLERMK